MAVQLGQVEPFKVSSCDWPSYEERIQALLRVNQVHEKSKVDVFISVIEPKMYSVFKSLTALAASSDKSLEEPLTRLRNHLSPKPVVIGERAKFHRHSQHEQTTIAQFEADLRTLAQTCEFGTLLGEALRDRFFYSLQRVTV